MKPWTIIQIIIGFAALLLGTIGIFLPIWPTTPFILLAVGCFSGTPRIQKWLLAIPFVREYYDSYTEKRPLRRKTAVFSLVFLWGMLCLSALLVRKPIVIVILGTVGAAVTIHLVYMMLRREKKHAETARNSALGSDSSGQVSTPGRAAD